MAASAQPTLALTLGDVKFCLKPDESHGTNGQVLFASGTNGGYTLTMNNFTGSLEVIQVGLSTATSLEQSVTLENREETASTNTPTMMSVDVTPKTSHVKKHAETSSPSSNCSSGSDSSRGSHKRSPPAEDRHDDEEEKQQCCLKVDRNPQEKKHKSPPTKKARSSIEDKAEVVEMNAKMSEREKQGDEDRMDDEASQPTLLGQMDLSQTQDDFLSMEGPTDEDEDEGLLHLGLQSSSDVVPSTQASSHHTENRDKESSKMLQQLLARSDSCSASVAPSQAEATQSPVPEQQQPSLLLSDDDDDEETEPPIATNIASDTNLQSAKKVPLPRVSIGSPPVVKQASPSPRWGHTLTQLAPHSYLVYGGQTFDAGSGGKPETLPDVCLYNTQTQKWCRPLGGDGMARQWHTATYLPHRQLLICLGGESPPATSKKKRGGVATKVKTNDQVMVLDTEIMLWYPPTVSGQIPSGRSGHSATVLPGGGDDAAADVIVLFGGVRGSKWLNTWAILNTSTWHWSTPKVTGIAPRPRSYHTATAVDGRKVVIFGGNGANASMDTVHVLEAPSMSNLSQPTQGDDEEGNIWRWWNPTVSGKGPAPRTGHSATLLPDGKTICIYGGWDPNDDNGDEDLVFDDSFLLDTETWVWRKGPKLAPCPSGEEVSTNVIATKRTGHAAEMYGDQEIAVFGGRVPGDTFSGDWGYLDVSEYINCNESA